MKKGRFSDGSARHIAYCLNMLGEPRDVKRTDDIDG